MVCVRLLNYQEGELILQLAFRLVHKQKPLLFPLASILSLHLLLVLVLDGVDVSLVKYFTVLHNCDLGAQIFGLVQSVGGEKH